MSAEPDDPPRAVVPADIDAPDKVVWGLTFRQAAILGVAAVAGWVLYRAVGHLLAPQVLAVVAVPVVALVAMVVLGRRDGLPMDAWLLAALRLRAVPRLQAPTPPPRPHSDLVATVGAPTVPGPLRLPADALSPTGVLSIGRRRYAVVATGTVNLGLRTGAEQAASLDGFAAWLNSLTTATQIVVSTQRFDLEPAAARVEETAPALPHPGLAAAARDYAGFLR
jgi:hypothetical protein